MKREKHFNLSDNQFLTEFKNCKLAPALFTHEAHLRLAYLLIKENELENATQIICDQIIKFVKNLNALDKFNLTLTIAATKAVHHFKLKSKSTNFEGFISEFPRLKNNFIELMSFHYSYNLLTHEDAKTKYLEPDLLPF